MLKSAILAAVGLAASAFIGGCSACMPQTFATEKCAVPRLTPDGGSYPSDQHVMMKEGAARSGYNIKPCSEIYYTLNKSIVESDGETLIPVADRLKWGVDSTDTNPLLISAEGSLSGTITVVVSAVATGSIEQSNVYTTVYRVA